MTGFAKSFSDSRAWPNCSGRVSVSWSLRRHEAHLDWPISAYPSTALTKVGEFDVPVVCDGLKCVPHFSRREGEPSRDREDVAEVSPSGTRRAALQRSDYLLGEDHLHRIAAQLYRFLTEQCMPAAQATGRRYNSRYEECDVRVEGGIPVRSESRLGVTDVL